GRWSRVALSSRAVQPTRATLSLPPRNGCYTGKQYHRSCDASNRTADDVRARDLRFPARTPYGRAAKRTSPFFHLLDTGRPGSARVHPDNRKFYAPVARARVRYARGRVRPVRRVHPPPIRSLPPAWFHRRRHWDFARSPPDRF